MASSVRTILRNASALLDDFDELQKSCDVTVEGNRIVAVARTRASAADATVIDIGGRTLMPGLIDAHAHITGLSLSPKNVAYPADAIRQAATEYLRASLMDGFTTIREAGGADYSIARLLNEGRVIGPRLFYSGRALTQTGGGADFRGPDETGDLCAPQSPDSVMSVIADGIDEVRRAAREELRRGAAQIKVFVSGGVVFPAEGHPTIYEYSMEELHAIVEEARGRGTYVMAHVYTDEGVRRCLAAGVRSIEHANYASEPTVESMARHGAFLVPTFISLVQRIETAADNKLAPAIVANLEATVAKGHQVYAWAKRYGVPIAFGTDLWGIDARRSELREFEMRMALDDPLNVIRSATRVNAALLNESGNLGVIQPGALADLIVIDGNPLENPNLLTRPATRLKLVMKDGAIYKNEL